MTRNRIADLWAIVFAAAIVLVLFDIEGADVLLGAAGGGALTLMLLDIRDARAKITPEQLRRIIDSRDQ